MDIHQLKMSATLTIQPVNEDEDNTEKSSNVDGGVEQEAEFDPRAPPPFNLSDVRAAIPNHCFVKNPWISISYVVRDVLVVFGLAAAAAYFNTWVVWPVYWVAQGTMFWALFVLGHDCGHGSFSNYPKLNSIAGYILHSSILVPYHGWRISHRTHHPNHGHVENDESFDQLSDKLFNSLDDIEKIFRFTFPFPMLAYPFYLWGWSPGKKGSHYNPNSDLLEATEAATPIFGKYCREPEKSGPFPFHLLGILTESLKQDHYVSDTGDVVYYQTDSKLSELQK